MNCSVPQLASPQQEGERQDLGRQAIRVERQLKDWQNEDYGPASLARVTGNPCYAARRPGSEQLR